MPTAIAFQGFLADSGGTPLDGSVDLDVALYDAPAGGNRVWPIAAPEAHAAVPVNDGVFQIAIGGIDPLVPDDFDGSPLYLGIAVNSEPELPRTQLLSTPFAIRAERADQADALVTGADLTTSGTATVGDGSSSALTVNGSVQINLPDGPGPFGTGGITISHPHDPASPFIKLGHATHTWTILHTGNSGNDLKIDDGSSGTADLLIGDDGSLTVGGTTATAGFQMSTGAVAGRVLTSDATGSGTWQLPGGDTDWTLSSGILSANAGAQTVGVGTTTPAAKLHVEGSTTTVDAVLGVSNYTGSLLHSGGHFEALSGGTGIRAGVVAEVTGNAGASVQAMGVHTTVNRNSSHSSACYYGVTTGAMGAGGHYGIFLIGEAYNYIFGPVGINHDFQTAGPPQVYLDVNGDARIQANLGVGVLPTERLHVAGNVFASGGDFYAAAGNGVINCGGGIMSATANIIADTTPTPTVATGDEDLFIGDDLEVVGNGFKTGGGSWATISDARLKRDVQPFEEGLESVLRIAPVRFRYSHESGLDDGREYVGVTAQDMLKVAPFMVEERALWQTVVEDEAGKESVVDPGKAYYTFDPSALDYMLINAVKEQQALIEKQREVIEALQRRVAALEAAR
ncbi:MAG: tail fiber domain-containing protein [Candidatus Eiseniibacteriota bacterium]